MVFLKNKRLGRQTVAFTNPPSIAAGSCVVGQKEGEGPLRKWFDYISDDSYFGQSSWEKAESVMLSKCFALCCDKARIPPSDIQYLFAGDLLNQCAGSTFAARDLPIPYFGVYGACSTMAESLLLGAMLIDGGFADTALCATCSHFSTAERQYRFPLELGNQRTPTAQWTVTGAGATLLGRENPLPLCIESVTIGSVWDLKQTDANNMGAAMAPAAMQTLKSHLDDLHRIPEDYDLIVTGDLGRVGYDLMKLLCRKEGIELDQRYIDCGCEIFDVSQDVHSGGSGCGCSAVSLNGWLLGRMLKGEIRKMLFLATGALMSPTMSQQGESIPGVAHAVSLEVMP